MANRTNTRDCQTAAIILKKKSGKPPATRETWPNKVPQMVGFTLARFTITEKPHGLCQLSFALSTQIYSWQAITVDAHEFQ